MHDGLGGLRANSWRTGVVHGNFEPITSRHPHCSLSDHHDSNLATKFGGYLSVCECLLDRGRKLLLPAKRRRTSAAGHLLDVGGLDSHYGFARPLRGWRVLIDLKS